MAKITWVIGRGGGGRVQGMSHVKCQQLPWPGTTPQQWEKKDGGDQQGDGKGSGVQVAKRAEMGVR